MSYDPESIPAVMNNTLKNLDILLAERAYRIERGVNVDEEGPFDFTQLVNSVLGALALPWEMLLKPELNKKASQRDQDLRDALRTLEHHLSDGSTRTLNDTEILNLLGNVRNARVGPVWWTANT